MKKNPAQKGPSWHDRRQGGLITEIILVIVAIVILSALGVNFQKIVSSPTFQSNFSYVWSGVLYVWNNFLAGPFTFIWNTLIVNFFWKEIVVPFLNSIQNTHIPTSTSG